MDIYVIKIAKSGMNSVEILIERGASHQKYSTALILEHILSVRKSLTYGISIGISDEKENIKTESEIWKVHDTDDSGVIFSPENILERNENDTAKILLNLSDTLPKPGSYLLHVVYDFRGTNIMDSCIGAGIAGAIKKLCLWHQGRLHVYTDCELSDHISSIFHFMDPCFQLYQCCVSSEAYFKVSTNQIWQGQFSFLKDNMENEVLHGFALSKVETKCEDQLMVNPQTLQSCAPSSEDVGYVWISPEIEILARINIATVPLMYFSNSIFKLEYRLNPRYPEMNEAVHRLCNALSLKPYSVFLCCLHYAFSGDQFSDTVKLSSDYWRQAILKKRENISSPSIEARQDASSQYFLLKLSGQDSSEHMPDVLQFTCHLLSKHEDINWQIPLEYFQLPPAIRNSNLGDEPEGNQLASYEFQTVNILPLLKRYNRFELFIKEALKDWLGHEVSSSISGNQLSSLIDKSLEAVNVEITRSCREPLEIQEADIIPSNSVEPTVYELQKQALEVAEEKNSTNSILANVGQFSGACAPLDMHFKPQDILKHFLHSGRLRNGLPIISKTLVSNSPSLCTDNPGSFTEIMNSSHHGILYNVDELESEKYDRTCRKLVERCVNYETCSIGSIDKVPSHSIILSGDSPFKNSYRNGKKYTKILDKKRHLKKVAEKLHQKRIETRRSNRSMTKPNSSSMVLRSTPKKSKVTKVVDDSQSDIPVREEKRHKRRTYVQDNKKRLEALVAKTLIENGVLKNSKRFESCSRRLYNVSMAFLRDLKSSKDLEKIMKDTVCSNVQSVISFKT